MSVRRLEELVYAGGDPADISVLGDALASFGEPRGELIALEAAAGHPLWLGKPIERYLEDYYTERAEPWREAFLAWAGPALARFVEDGWVELRFHAGFVDARVRFRPDAYAALHGSAPGRVLRSLELYGDGEEVRAMLACLGRKQRWLGRLVVASWRNPGAPFELGALAPLLPRLEELSLYGPRVASRIPPGVRTLRLAGVPELELAGPLPQITHLDLARYPQSSAQSGAPPPSVAIASRRLFPNLVGLDLSRNEPGQTAPANLGGYPGEGSIFDELAGLDVLPGLAELRLPSLRTGAAVTAARGALARLPAAARLSITRAYDNRYCGLAPRCAELADDPRVLRPPVFPFPSLDHTGKDALWIDDDHVVGIRGIVTYLEAAWASLDEPARQAWRAFWRFLDELPYEDDAAEDVIERFPRATLMTAVETCEGIGRRPYRDLRRGGPIYADRGELEHLWVRLLQQLRKRPGGDTVTVQRKWGVS